VTFPFASLPDNLAAFCDVLRRDHRFRIGPRELHDAARALEITPIGDERAVRDALRPVLSSTFDDAQVFDFAFDGFFHRRRTAMPTFEAPGSTEAAEQTGATPTSLGGSEEHGERRADTWAEPSEGGTGAAVRDVSDEADEVAVGVLRASYSPLEAEGAAPALEPPDDAWLGAAAALIRSVHLGLSRRWQPAPRGRRFDLRRTLRSSLHTAGDVVTPRWRARSKRKPRFVLLIDGSRSMEGGARPALQTATALTAIAGDTETFAFSTSLRRVTRDVRRAAAGERRQLHWQHAWGGGTTIGACVNEFLIGFGERLLGRDTIVIIASDGLDVGDPDLLRQTMAQLSRRAAALVWINPLVDTPGYEPSALGMSVARPFVRVLTAVNDPTGLVSLARRIRVR
jgi:uncharacterized protein with von Willebrand factor type A (vWA) domain